MSCVCESFKLPTSDAKRIISMGPGRKKKYLQLSTWHNNQIISRLGCCCGRRGGEFVLCFCFVLCACAHIRPETLAWWNVTQIHLDLASFSACWDGRKMEISSIGQRMKSSSINMEIWKLSKLTIKSQFDSWCVGHTSLSSVECAQEIIAYLQTIHLMWWTWVLPKKWSNKWRRKCFNIYHFWFIHRWVNININNK